MACGYNQEYGINYFNSYTPTLSLSSFRALLAIASAHKLSVHSVDINTAFLTGPIDCKVYMMVPPGLDPSLLPEKERQLLLTHKGLVSLLLKKGVYGLVQAGNLYWTHFIKKMKCHGFKQIYSDPCILLKKRDGRTIIISVYVDDINIFYRLPTDLTWVMSAVGESFKFKNLGKIQLCLGINVGRTPQGHYFITQKNYIERMGDKFGILPGKRARTPLPCKNLNEFSHSPKIDPSPYRSLIGAILYVSVATRPDVAYAISHLASFSGDPREMHLKAATHLLRYLINTSSYRILYDGKIRQPNSLYIESREKGKLSLGFCDASFNSLPKTSRSITGFLVFLFGGPVTWRKINQKIVTTSSAEAEYVAMSAACREILFIRQLCQELGYTESYPTDLYSDASAAISIAQNPGFTQRSKSIRLHNHNVRDSVQQSVVKLRKIEGTKNPADALTKSLNRAQTSLYNMMFFNTSSTLATEQDHKDETLNHLIHIPVDDDGEPSPSPQDGIPEEEPLGDDDEDDDEDASIVILDPPNPANNTNTNNEIKVLDIPNIRNAQSDDEDNRELKILHIPHTRNDRPDTPPPPRPTPSRNRIRQREHEDSKSERPLRRQRTNELPPSVAPITLRGLIPLVSPEHKNFYLLSVPEHELPRSLQSSIRSTRETFTRHRLTSSHVGGYTHVLQFLEDMHHLERQTILNIVLAYEPEPPRHQPGPIRPTTLELRSLQLSQLLPPSHRNHSLTFMNEAELPSVLRLSLHALREAFISQRAHIVNALGYNNAIPQLNESQLLQRRATVALYDSYDASDTKRDTQRHQSPSSQAPSVPPRPSPRQHQARMPPLEAPSQPTRTPNDANSSPSPSPMHLSRHSALSRSSRWLTDNCCQL